jgi:hypothetical protein
MQVADLGPRVDDALAVEQRLDAQRAVGGRVRRADVDVHALEAVLAEDDLAPLVLRGQPGNAEYGARKHVAAVGRIVLAQGEADELLVREDAAQVRVVDEVEPEHVVGLALGPVRRLPQAA